jgi:fatty-acyl-CoA synthase
MTAAPNFAYNMFAKRLRRQARPGQFDLSWLRRALSGAEQVEAVRIASGGDPAGVRHGRDDGGGVVHRVRGRPGRRRGRCGPVRGGAPGGTGDRGQTRRLATLGRLLTGMEARVVDEDGSLLPARGVGVIQVRGAPVTDGYVTVAGLVAVRDDQGWYDTGDLGYLTETGKVVVCGRVKDVIIMAGRNIYPTDIERAAARVSGVRPGCAVAVRLDAGLYRETFAVAAESAAWQDEAEVRCIEHQVADEVVVEVDIRPRSVVVLAPGLIPKAQSGKLRRAFALALVS